MGRRFSLWPEDNIGGRYLRALRDQRQLRDAISGDIPRSACSCGAGPRWPEGTLATIAPPRARQLVASLCTCICFQLLFLCRPFVATVPATRRLMNSPHGPDLQRVQAGANILELSI